MPKYEKTEKKKHVHDLILAIKTCSLINLIESMCFLIKSLSSMLTSIMILPLLCIPSSSRVLEGLEHIWVLLAPTRPLRTPQEHYKKE